MNRLWKLAQRNIQKIALKSGEGESEIDYSLLVVHKFSMKNFISIIQTDPRIV